MSEVKQRKNRSAFTKKSRAPPDHNVSGDKTAITKPAKKGKCPTNFVEATESVLNMHLSKINFACGLLIMLFIGYKYALYTKTLHENDMWFSNIREVEREISFRTESGLYYSYYKQFVNAPSVKQGWYELTHDNITEHLNTINVLERMNIYQEVLLGLLYRSLPVKNVEPVYFYINSIFALQGMLLCALYVTAWLLSGSWLAGALATAFYILNKADTTRVELAIPLRESFSLPFLWVEVAAATYYLRPRLSLSKERLVLCVLTLSTFCMAVTWQFNQFVLLLQGLALYGVWLLDMLPGYKVRRMLGVIAFSLLGTCILQYVNTMILCSLVLSLILSTLLLMYITGDQPRQCSITTRIASLFLKLVFTAVSTVTINKAIKIILQEEADEHIYKFVQNKFGFGFSRDFDVRMYLCNGAFQFLPMDTYVRLTERFVFPTYVIVTIVLLGCLVTALIQHWWPPSHKVPAEDKQKAEEGQSPLTATHLLANRPELAYHLVQSVLFGVMAVMVLRMKYLWTPYMCILASWGISDYQTWKFVLAKLNIRREIFVQCIRNIFSVSSRADTTRVELAIPLRESFSLPFLWVEVAAATYYLRPRLSLSKERLVLCVLTLSTFCMAVTWQFNQFVLLLQGLALYGVWLLDMLPGYKVRRMLGVIAFSLLGTCILQYVNTMILCSLVLSLILSTLLLMYITGDQPRQCSITTRIASLFLKLVFTAVSTVTINKAIKIILQEEADEHIYKFVQNKFGFGFSRDFDVRMYLCNGAFQFLPMDTYVRLTERFVFPTYVIVTIVLLGCLVTALIQHWWPPGHKVPAEDKQKAEEGQSPLTATHLLANRPELAYHLVQSILFGAMAVMVLRMKYLWTPYMCILASWGISDYQTWKFVLAKLNIRREIFVQCIRHVSTCTMLAVLLAVSLPSVWKELEDLREFYDPDTVDLMEWVKKSVPREAAFTGSMQLLAGVKLCTERHITNHPHYEDKGLRMRTKELYQMYGRRTPEDVWTIMKKYNASYIILEDSICMAPSDDCRTPDIIDMDNGVIPDHGNFSPGLVPSKVPRFCDEIRYGRPAYTKYFKKVFVNRTFRVYQVLT
ncbi:probable C-mannosyltransferase DPY19L3 [Lingula anatina]|uniref:Probable C-mannosyltransferase DPY19L3 n=1 Tax=Lingula anatina TaxID=7574 RepID=A0A2R2MKL7_LINAN|nr:probable C-mannosyltransferase DPY19L3 [Lingula anatina]|eukprot:XP_023930612.1 probable C-mannosyltransferase DPY19L3 [Lingula anatina]